MKLRTMAVVSVLLVTAFGTRCLAEPKPAIEMQQIMDDLRTKWHALDEGFGYEGEAFEANYLACTIDPATGSASALHVAAQPVEERSHVSLESSGAIYSVLEKFVKGNQMRRHFGLNEVFLVSHNGHVGSHEPRTAWSELRALSRPIFTPDRIWNGWLEYPWPTMLLYPNPSRTITSKVLRATNDELVEGVECARIDEKGERIAEHREFVAKPVKDLGWLPVEVRDVCDNHVERSSKITWAAIKIGDQWVPIPEKIEIEAECLDPATKGWLKGSSLGLKIDMATFITPSTVKDDKRPWAEVEARELKLTAELPPAPKAPDLTN